MHHVKYKRTCFLISEPAHVEKVQSENKSGLYRFAFIDLTFNSKMTVVSKCQMHRPDLIPAFPRNQPQIILVYAEVTVYLIFVSEAINNGFLSHHVKTLQ